ncbi:hypothetical protein Pan153_32290 [Gimesia panareensis]|uniref:Glycosyltransferase RgtA/B/C/D-like domain-containing protein n=2 Tax=Gimesia panareensis TaxID=2527978 RepID=A0A517Q154_9PLAN|nr:hypothetical protein Enr10x_06590 [Gimesia panareensis]QDU48324.1 hypothetical protein Pan110_06370 [Gimesia panareensis]QDV18570.1 hypothetical protein Pan153_32290 [Gimesia panareensis]
MSTANPVIPDTESSDRGARWNTSTLSLGALILLLVAATPQLICMPVTNDVSYYDLQARTVMRGGMLYRDMVEPNFPGVVWVHILVRSLAGWSTEVLRVFDLLVFCLTVFCLTRFVSAVRFQVGLLLFLAYYSVSEWCHVQRDLWLLLPAAVALNLRWAQIQRSTQAAVVTRSLFLFGTLEGLVWGAGVWLKPHVVIPALAVWLCSLFNPALRKKVWSDLGGLLTGGLIAGALGVGWLYFTGTWPWFLEMQLDWNREYLTQGNFGNHYYVFLNLAVRFFPYILIHLVAVPMALVLLIRQDPQRPPQVVLRLRLLSALYLAWILQVVLLQHPFDYVHFPPMLLGMTLLVYAFHCTRRARLTRWILTGGFLVAALWFSPVTKPAYLRLWSACLEQGSTGAIRNQLARIPYPDWEDMERVAAFLKSQQAQDREVTCFSNDMIHLYLDLNLEPSTRYVYTHSCLEFYPSRRPLILKTLRNSPQRFVLSNLMAGGLLVSQAKEVGPEGPSAYPPAFPEHLKTTFPWNLPIAFRAGTLVVHRYPGEPIENPPQESSDKH